MKALRIDDVSSNCNQETLLGITHWDQNRGAQVIWNISLLAHSEGAER